MGLCDHHEEALILIGFAHQVIDATLIRGSCVHCAVYRVTRHMTIDGAVRRDRVVMTRVGIIDGMHRVVVNASVVLCKSNQTLPATPDCCNRLFVIFSSNAALNLRSGRTGHRRCGRCRRGETFLAFAGACKSKGS